MRRRSPVHLEPNTRSALDRFEQAIVEDDVFLDSPAAAEPRSLGADRSQRPDPSSTVAPVGIIDATEAIADLAASLDGGKKAIGLVAPAGGGKSSVLRSLAAQLPTRLALLHHELLADRKRSAGPARRPRGPTPGTARRHQPTRAPAVRRGRRRLGAHVARRPHRTEQPAGPADHRRSAPCQHRDARVPGPLGRTRPSRATARSRCSPHHGRGQRRRRPR